jgi:TolA-binding protein
MGRRTDSRRALVAAFLGIALVCGAGRAAVAELPPTSDPLAADRFRAAAALQNRALYDLAAAEWAAFAQDYPADPLTASARYQRGVCLAQLDRYEEARTEFWKLLTGELKLEPALEQKCYYQTGLARYNLALACDGRERQAALRSAIVDFDQQLTRYPEGTLAAQATFYRCEAIYATGLVESAATGYRALLEEYPDHPQRAEALYGLGVAEQEAGQFVKATATLEKFATEFPDHASATDARVRRAESLLAAGEHYLAVGQTTDALDVLSVAAALPRWSRADAVLLALAGAEQGAGRPRDAIATVDRLIAEHGESGLLDRAYQRRAEAHAACDDWSAAVADYGTIVERWPESALVPTALVARARAQLKLGEAAAAETSLDRFLSDHAEHELAREAQVLRATVRHEQGNFAGGIADADAVLAAGSTRPVRSDALYIRGLSQLALCQPAEAAATFDRIVQKDPQYRAMDRVLYDLAWAHQESHDAERAIATFARLAETCPESPLAAEGWYRIGEVHFSAGDYSLAATEFQSTLERAQEPALRERAAHKLAWCRFEQQDFAAAEKAFAEQLAAHPQGALAGDARLMQAECHFRRQQYHEALEAYVAASDVPNVSGALRQSALLHATQAAAHLGQWQRCLELADRAIAEFPSARWTDEARCERGTALFHLGRVDEAQQELVPLAANRDPTGARAEWMLGKIQAAQGNADEAVRTFFKVAYGYGDTDAPEPYRRWQAESLYDAAACLEQTGRVESAGKLYEELLARHPSSAKAAEARNALKQILRR